MADPGREKLYAPGQARGRDVWTYEYVEEEEEVVKVQKKKTLGDEK